ncbi:MAG: FKBP-type peptidyl-prolyl cis-trans isomerase [Actinomycetota bacterium]
MIRSVSTALPVSFLASVLVLTGCGSEPANENSVSQEATSVALAAVTVGGSDVKKKPTITVKSPVSVSRTESKVVTNGNGAEIAKQDLVSLHVVVVKAKDGKEALSTWESGVVGVDLGGKDLFASFRNQIPGKKIGSRMVITSTPADAFGAQGNTDLGIAKDDSVVFVLDLVAATKILDEATGTPVPPKDGLPAVKMNDGKPATITVPQGAKPPTKTVVQQLVQGEGVAVQKGQTIRVSYTGALWRNGEVFDSSANRPEQPYFSFPMGQGQVIKGWDNGLLGQKVGSRVLLIVPPADGYGSAGSGDTIKGTDTLVFVVDILAAY